MNICDRRRIFNFNDYPRGLFPNGRYLYRYLIISTSLCHFGNNKCQKLVMKVGKLVQVDRREGSTS